MGYEFIALGGTGGTCFHSRTEVEPPPNGGFGFCLHAERCDSFGR